jgi:hypothetical protein
MTQHLRTAKQTEILSKLTQNFDIDETRILFLNPRDEAEPWIPADELTSIARQHGGFKSIGVEHEKFIPETNQVIYTATVVDAQDRIYIRSGAATFGETAGNGLDIDADTLAQGRALGASLRAAGFHPYKSGSIVDLGEFRRAAMKLTSEEQGLQKIEDESISRKNDLAQMHKLAEEKGLIVVRPGNVRDMTKYRSELKLRFNTDTAATLDRAGRAAVINWLKTYDNFLENVPQELREDAMVA